MEGKEIKAVELWRQLATMLSEMSRGNYEKAINDGKKLMELSLDSPAFKLGKAETLRCIGRAYFMLDKCDEAIDYLTRALEVAEAANLEEEAVHIFIMLGNVYAKKGNDDRALDYFDKSVKLAKKIEDNEMEAIALNNIANIYCRRNECKRALDYSKDALSLFLKSRTSSPMDKAEAYFTNALILEKLGNMNPAISSCRLSFELYKEAGNEEKAIEVLIKLGDMYYSLGDNKNAMECWEQSADMCERSGLIKEAVDILGKIHERKKETSL